MQVIDPKELLNRTFLTQPDDTGQRFRAKVVQLVQDQTDKFEKQPERIKYLI